MLWNQTKKFLAAILTLPFPSSVEERRGGGGEMCVYVCVCMEREREREREEKRDERKGKGKENERRKETKQCTSLHFRVLADQDLSESRA